MKLELQYRIDIKCANCHDRNKCKNLKNCEKIKKIIYDYKVKKKRGYVKYEK